MIAPTEPIVTGQTAPMTLAVPVGPPFPSTPPKPARPVALKSAALTPQIVSLRASMLVPVECNPAVPPTTRGQFTNLLSKGGQALSQAAAALRGHPRSTGLGITAILLGISLTSVIILSDPPEPDVTTNQQTEEPRLAAAPAVEPAPATPTGMAEESDALAGIRIVDPSWDKKSSCNEGTWPYIDQRCLIKDETGSDSKVETKIGPRMIDSRTRPNVPEAAGPIGSTTAIVPAAPKVNATDGVATRDMEMEKHNEDMLPEKVSDIAPAKLAETRTSTVPAQAITPRYSASSQRYRPVRTFRLSEEAKPVPPRRVVSAKRKRQPVVADAGRRAHARAINQAQAPQPPQFFFPFGWFVQAR